MPVATGLYTLLLPMAVFAVLGSSGHLVVAADSATAAILAGALIGLAAPGSPRYVHLAGLAALLTGGLLLLARLARLGFLANFLSRTVLAGFLTGVGIQVAAAQLPDMLGITASGTHTLSRLGHTLAALPRAHPGTVAVSAAVILVLLATRKITRRIPGPLIAVTGAIVVSRAADLARRGVAVIGPVHRGLPPLGPPALGLHDASGLLGPATWMFVVTLGQSAATAHAYADRHGETVSADTDLVGLGAANLAAAFSGTFVVNGSPTQTQMVDGAGGRSQLAQLTAGGVVLAVLLFLTGPPVSLPTVALAAVVFVIGVELVDAAELRRILSVRGDEFAIALLAAASVVVLSVQDGIILAALASIIGHLPFTYHPRNCVLVKSSAGHWQAAPVRPGARTEEGLVVYRFGASLYYANASWFREDVSALTGQADPVFWLVADGAAIGHVDYTAASVLRQVAERLRHQGTRLVLTNLLPQVRGELGRYGITGVIGPGAYYDTPGQALKPSTRHLLPR